MVLSKHLGYKSLIPFRQQSAPTHPTAGYVLRVLIVDGGGEGERPEIRDKTRLSVRPSSASVRQGLNDYHHHCVPLNTTYVGGRGETMMMISPPMVDCLSCPHVTDIVAGPFSLPRGK